MMMGNRTGLKRCILETLAVTAFFLGVFSCALYGQYKGYTAAANEKIGAVLREVEEKYPRVEESELIGILNGKGGDGGAVLRKYGIDIEKEAVVLENDENFRKYILLDGGLLLLLFFAVLGLFLRYNGGRDKEISEITDYLTQINRGNYKLDISDNSEDSLSILKNEIYKTAVKLNEAAENSMRDKVRLKDSLSDISHQLKTPLTSIMVRLDAILDDADMEEATRNAFIRDIKREVAGTEFFVESLLKLSKLDSNTMKFVEQEADIADILAKAVSNVEILGELKNISIEVSGKAEGKLLCDFKWQTEAFTNIIKNCMEHSGEYGEIRIAYADNPLYTEVKIRDFGTGVAPEDLPHIFERFYQGKNSSGENAGIGLALAKAIIEKDNGYIRAESREGEGTVFYVRYLR